MTKSVFILFAGILAFAAVCLPVRIGWCQEFFLYGGKMENVDAHDSATSWGLGFFQGLGEHAAVSLMHLNEGHVPNHHRDGYAAQVWLRTDVFKRRLSFLAGLGPHFYFDTRFTDHTDSVDTHGLGVMYSAALTWYAGCGLLFQIRGNWIEVQNDFSHLSVMGGLGYQLDPPAEDSADLARRKGGTDTGSQITLSAGDSVFNGAHADHTFAGALEYRRGIHPHLDVSFAFITEDSSTNHRYGIVGQLWAVRTVFSDRLSFGVGVGPYLAHDKNGRGRTRRVNGALGVTGAMMLGERLVVRGTWQRVVTPYDDDADIFLGGVGWRF